jgi:hypothetical protein
MSATRVCLTFVAGREIRDELIDHLAEQSDLVPGFTSSDAEGHGPTVRLHSPAEQVKGRADRVLVRIVLDDAAAAELIARIERAFAGSGVVYWTTPISSSGSLRSVDIIQCGHRQRWLRPGHLVEVGLMKPCPSRLSTGKSYVIRKACIVVWCHRIVVVQSQNRLHVATRPPEASRPDG